MAVKITFNEYREFEKLLTEAADTYGEKIPVFDGAMSMGASAAKNLIIFLFKVFDPTGISSWPDLVKALERYAEEPDKWNFVCVIAALICIIPTFAIDAAVAAAVASTGIGAPAAPPAALGTHLTVSLIKALAKVGSRVLRMVPGGGRIAAAIKVYGTKLLKNNANTVIAYMRSGIASGKIPKNLLPTLNKIFRRLQFSTRAIQGLFNMGADTAQNITKSITGAGGVTDQDQEPVVTTAPDEQKIPYQLPDGRIIYTTPAAVQSSGTAPIEQPSGEPAYNVGGQTMTRGQAQATGPYYTAVPPTYGRTRGEYIPQNIQQGATTNSFGRPFMAPTEYMRPDNFNNPPTFFGPQSFYRSPYNYNPYSYGQQNYSYGQQNMGIAGMLANMGNIFGGTLAGVGSLAGQMAGTPVAGIANMAGSLLSILPGMGSVGANPLYMGMPSVGGI